MNKNAVTKTVVAMIILAAAPYASASSLVSSELNNVRGVLRGLNIDESQLSNEDIELLRKSGSQIRSYEKMKKDYLKKSSDGSVNLTCGAGSHGGSGDPV